MELVGNVYVDITYGLKLVGIIYRVELVDDVHINMPIDWGWWVLPMD